MFVISIKPSLLQLNIGIILHGNLWLFYEIKINSGLKHQGNELNSLRH